VCNPNGGPSIPLQDHFQGWELIHFASKAKRYGLLDNDARLALYEAGRLRMRGESLNHLLLGRVESALSALIDADLGAAECDRGDCDACGRLAVLGPESTPPPVPAAPVVALEEPASPISPDVGALLTISYTPERIPELAFSRRDAEVLDKVRGGLVESPSAWALHYQARLLGLQSGFDRLLCLPLLRDVRHYDYQKNTALKVLREMRGRAILADEVGLADEVVGAPRPLERHRAAREPDLGGRQDEAPVERGELGAQLRGQSRSRGPRPPRGGARGGPGPRRARPGPPRPARTGATCEPCYRRWRP